MITINNSPFTTRDRDNDNRQTSCAKSRRSGWWHPGCTNANLNGQYYNSSVDSQNGIYWVKWRNSFNSMKQVDMKIKLN